MDKDEMIEEAWGLIANAGFAPLNWGGTNLSKEEKEWVEAASVWRDKYHALIRSHYSMPAPSHPEMYYYPY